MYGYNERRNNFGCRSTPKALKYMLSNNNEIAYSLDNLDHYNEKIKGTVKKLCDVTRSFYENLVL